MKLAQLIRTHDPTGITSHGCEEAKRRIAAALGTNPYAIDLHRYDLDLSGWSFHSTGTCRGKRFFAKIYLHDFNPPLRRIPRYVTPETELDLLLHPEKSFGGSVESEYRMFTRIATPEGNVHLPTILGKSAEEGTLVFEELQGIRMDSYVRWRRWGSSTLHASTSLIVRAAAWLRNLHRDTFDGNDDISTSDVLQTIRSIVTLNDLESTRYGELALGILSTYADSLNTATLQVPRCVCHADFSFNNLIWDRRRNRLNVIDFEHSVFGNVLYDLCGFIFYLRSHLLLPFTSASVVKAWEEAFWAGYGVVSNDIAATVNALATGRLFFFLLPRLINRRQRRGWIAGAEAAFYIRWFEPTMIERTLKSLEWFKRESWQFSLCSS